MTLRNQRKKARKKTPKKTDGIKYMKLYRKRQRRSDQFRCRPFSVLTVILSILSANRLCPGKQLVDAGF